MRKRNTDVVEPPRRGNWRPTCAFALVIASVCGWALAHAWLVDAVIARLCERMDPPGSTFEERLPVYLPQNALDGYLWLQHAEAIGADGSWRHRHTLFDNHPDGREVHWNSAYTWYLRGLGEVRHRLTGEPLRHSLFRASLWANPLLLAAAVLIIAPLAARRFGLPAGAVMAVLMIAAPNFYGSFAPANPDHHGLIALAILGMVLGIASAGAGWAGNEAGAPCRSARTVRHARGSMILSGLSGAAGMWFSAISTSIALAGIGVGVLAAALLYGRRADASGHAFNGGLWRIWGLAGAGGSLFFYLLEYFPWHVGLRLEVNHPLYALAWLGGAWGMAALCGWLARPAGARPPFPVVELLGPAAACALLPLAILAGGPSVFAPLDPFLARLHTYIIEFLPLWESLRRSGYAWHSGYLCYPAVLAGAAALLCSRRVDPHVKRVLVFLGGVILMITAFKLHQNRWGVLAGPLYVALGGLAAAELGRLAPPQRLWRLLAAAGLGALLLATLQTPARQFFVDGWAQARPGGQLRANPMQTRALLHRDIAAALREQAAGRPVVILSSVNSSILIAGLGGFRTIGTLYWENAAGLRAAANMFSAQTDEEALLLLRRHGVTHIVLMNWQNGIEPYFESLYPIPPTGVSLDNAFGKRLVVDRHLPVWTRPVPYPENALTRALGETILILEVAPGQSLEEAELYLARYQAIQTGDLPQLERSLRALIGLDSQAVRLRLELARLYAAVGHGEAARALASEAATIAESRAEPALQAQAEKLRELLEQDF